MMELVDMSSLGLFDFKSCPFKSDLPQYEATKFSDLSKLNLFRV